jgi:hypothetical protein
MDVLGELQAVAAELALHDERPTCQWCGLGKLILIDERADPNFGALGMTWRVLKCDAPECSKLTSV